MKVGIYNRWLSILGGGERYMLTLALALADAGHAVTLLTEQPASPADALRRLGLDISGLAVQQLPDGQGSYGHISDASAGFDLFINASHGDLFPALAPRSWLLVFFPEQLLPDEDVLSSYIWSGGYAEERDGRGRAFRWLAPEGALWLMLERGPQTLAVERPQPATLTLSSSGWSTTLELRPGRRERLDLPAFGGLVRWSIAPLASPDPRPLGVQLYGLERRSMLRRILTLPALTPDPQQALATYQTLLAISPYVARWTESRWGRETLLLEPPVPPIAPAAKGRSILSVGRFFRGLHTKRHDALIEAMRQLAPAAPGWELHLAGGLDEANPEHAAYVEELRRAAEGLPIHFHINCDGDTLARLYGAAALYWHAAGYASDPEAHPEAQEHFGITTVEAMSAGCVPLVHGSGGPAEVIAPGLTGYHWHTTAQLATLTADLIANPQLIEQMSRAAQAAAQKYAPAQFAQRVHAALPDL